MWGYIFMVELAKIPLFSKLNETYLEELQTHMTVHEYKKDNIVFFEGDESKYLHILLEGEVKLYKTSSKGTQIYIHDFTAPDIIALFATFEKIPFPATCEFLTGGKIGLLPLEALDKCLDNVDFSLSLTTALSKRMRHITELFHKETIYSSEAKIADVLYNDPTIFKRLKNSEIASILNITPETLSRTLTKFKKEEIISIKNHVVTILDEEMIQSIIK
jgi:CRP/FNR family transcriptional regulator